MGGGKRGLDAASFGLLLARLGTDAERAGIAYEELRLLLAKFFDWRGTPYPEECADEAIDRLATKLEEGHGIDDVRSFALGIARMVSLERWRRPSARAARADEAELDGLPAPEPPDEGPRRACFERCLAELPGESRDLILRYYVAERRIKIDNRRRMAEQLGLTEQALRSRAQRIRGRLERCIGRCVSPAPQAGSINGRVADTKE